MIRSMWSAVSGLRNHQIYLDVTGNNIANVNTHGYKSTRAVFEDSLSQVVRNASAPDGGNGVGGMNPTQIGLGVRLGQVSGNFAQGGLQVTNVATDLAVQGDGFFVVKKGGEQIYTRNGAFSLDKAGDLVTADGSYVQGDMWFVTRAPAAVPEYDTWMRLSPAQQAAADAGQGPYLDVKIAAALATGGSVTPNPAPAPPTVILGPNVYAGATGPTASAASAPVEYTSFEPGSSWWLSPPAGADPPPPPQTSWPSYVDRTAAGTYSLPRTEQLNLDASTWQSFQIAPNGMVSGVRVGDPTGKLVGIGQLALAKFNNPNGLERVGGTSFKETLNSGRPITGFPTSGARASATGLGLVTSGTLEMSNVDLAAEFTNLIMAQRGFQANSKIVTASDEVLTDLINMKR